MAAKKTATEEVVQEAAARAELRFSKNQLRNCREFRNRKDLLNVLLEDDKTYTKSEARTLIEEFMSRPIKKK